VRLVLAFCVFAGMAEAAPPETSLRPSARSLTADPDARPEPVRVRPADTMVEAVSLLAAAASLRPVLRPPQVVERAVAQRRERRRGSICGTLEIQGEAVGAIRGRIEGCGIDRAVRVRSVSGVTLTQRPLVDCRTAKSLNTWVKRSAKPALSGTGGGLARLRVAAHYVCRTRNHQAGARISEHGKGRAIDISGFLLRDGTEISVERGWAARATRRAMRRMHRGACDTFGTVLGPDADSFHRDHFHFDTARYRSGSYCR